MKKSEIFEIVANKVCEVCEVQLNDVISGVKLQSVVDARLLIVQYLRRTGLSNDDIALAVLRKLHNEPSCLPVIDEVKRKAKGVEKMFSAYSTRCLQSYAFCLMSQEVKEFCRERYKDYYLVGMKQLPE